MNAIFRLQPTQTQVEESSIRLEVVAVVVEEVAVDTTIAVNVVMGNKLVIKFKSALVGRTWAYVIKLRQFPSQHLSQLRLCRTLSHRLLSLCHRFSCLTKPSNRRL